MPAYRSRTQPSRGTAAFQKAVGDARPADIARELGCDAGQIVHILKGRRGAGLQLGTKIYRRYGVEPSLWTIPLKKSRPLERATVARVEK